MANISDFLGTAIHSENADGDVNTLTIWTGTEAEYALIVTPDPDTLYFVTE